MGAVWADAEPKNARANTIMAMESLSRILNRVTIQRNGWILPFPEKREAITSEAYPESSLTNSRREAAEHIVYLRPQKECFR